MSNFDLNALSGINAMSQGMGVISNNLANSQTVGFKTSRAEFADLFSGAQNSPGNGVRLNGVVQDFTQGTVSSTGRELDLAIDGEGFFILADQTGQYNGLYTRNGSFKVDKDGFVTDQSGNILQGFNQIPALSTETNPVFSTALEGINLGQLSRTPKATDEMTYNINLNGEAPNNIDPTQPTGTPNSVGTNNSLASIAAGTFGGFADFTYPRTIHDSLGGEHQLNANFYKRGVVGVDPLGQFTTQFVTPYNDALTAYNNAQNPTTEQNLLDAYNALRAGFSVDGGNQPALAYTSTDLLADQAAAIAGADAATQTAITGETTFLENNNNDLGQKYTSWIVSYDISSFNELTGQFEPSGVRGDGGGNATDDLSVVYELRFDTDGRLIDVRSPSTPGNLSGRDNPNLELDNDKWVSVGSRVPNMTWVINNPGFGGTDPLGRAEVSPETLGITVGFDDMTQFASDYVLRGVTQNGFRVGDLVGLTIDGSGIIEARYSNGRNLAVAQLALANFNDLNALEKLGGQMYAESFNSGPVQISAAGSGTVGNIRAGSLEFSNVDVASELVKMIQLQRTYQASAQVISTSQELTRTILNL